MSVVRDSRIGVTLIEMLIVLALIGLLVAISFPSVSAGVDSLRLSSSGDSLVSFLNGVMNRAERRQQPIEVTIDVAHNSVVARSAEPGFERRLELATGVHIVSVLPASPAEDGEPRRFVLYPGGTPPRIGVEMANVRGARRIIRIDPITGVPEVERLPSP
jgi:prepilin-type N-terminal cleavage/methylation domain-containing protein